jgi:hypothetical protein
MSTTTIAVIPKEIRAALDAVIDHVLPAAAEKYHALPEIDRGGHIYETIETVWHWMSEIQELPDTFAIATALEAEGYLADIWSIEDVREIRPDLDETQCRAVLDECRRSFNAETGINWDVLRDCAEALFPEPEEIGEEQGRAQK